MAFTILDYVIERLNQQGVNTLFGVPLGVSVPPALVATADKIIE